MLTRQLESNAVTRATVTSAEVLETTATSVLLRTSAVVTGGRNVSSADANMAIQQELARSGQTIEGRVHIDVLSDDVIRIRYAEGDAVPENATPMVVGTLVTPTRCEIVTGGQTETGVAQAPWLDAAGDAATLGQMLTLETAALCVRVILNPYRVEISDLQGNRICGVGGPEKDNFCNWDSFNTGICRSQQDQRPIAVENFDLQHNEAIYGLGEKFLKLNKVGQTVDLHTTDALGVVTPRSYKNIPFYVSTGGYGVFFNHSSLMTYWVGSMTATDVQVAVADDDFLDYYIFTGSIKEVLARYTDLTGKGVMPPAWTFGYWQSKISYTAAEETLEIARQLRAHQVPCDVMHLDTHWFKEDWYCDLEFDAQRFPDPAAYLRELADMGIKVSLWQLPYIPEGSQLYADLLAVDGFVKNHDGSIYNLGLCFTPGFSGVVGVIDYSNPAAVTVHQDYFRRLFRLGVKVIKTDFGESAPIDGVYYDGTPGTRMHNLYPLLYNKALFEVTQEETGDGVVWARSAWAGNQRYPLHWGGDNSPNYFNMAPQLEGGLSFGLSGFQFWSQDIGGFCGKIDDRLLIRWMQLGMFLSHSRIHGFGDRELYKFAPETQRICGEFIRLRYRLMPYLLATAQDCVDRALPMARALVVDYQTDPTTWNIGDEFLLGDSLLVAPILAENDHRLVYLPAGEWTDWWTGERIPGPCWLPVHATLDTMPLYQREGSIIPMGPVMNYVNEKPIDHLDLLVSLFTHDGQTHCTIPLNGQQVAVEYHARQGQHSLTIGPTAVDITVKPLGDGDVKLIRL